MVTFKYARSTREIKDRAATRKPGTPFQLVGHSAPVVYWTYDRDITLVIGAHHMYRYRHWRAALSHAMYGISTTKANHLSHGAKVALVGCHTSSVTRRLNHINLHRFWTRRPSSSDHRGFVYALMTLKSSRRAIQNSIPVWQASHAQEMGEFAPHASHPQRHSPLCACPWDAL